MALTIARLRDAELAERMLEKHIDLLGLDLSHLPGLHLGPVATWLALLADAADDPRAEGLGAAADARFHALGADRRMRNRAD